MNANTSAAAIVEDVARLLVAERFNHGSCCDRGCRVLILNRMNMLDSIDLKTTRARRTRAEEEETISLLSVQRDVAPSGAYSNDGMDWSQFSTQSTNDIFQFKS